MSNQPLTEEERQRYSRHLLLEEMGEEGQRKLQKAKVLIVGAGGLGSPVSLYLAAAGLGKIGIIDGDEVDRSNLQRQIVHFTSDVGRSKVESARDKINALNPHVDVVLYKEFLTETNARRIIPEYDFVVSCTDNFSVRFLINDACVALGKPFSHAGISKFDGQMFTYTPGNACLRCLFKTTQTSEVGGLIGATVGILGSIQATETIKYFTGIGRLLTNKLLTIDAKSMDFYKFNVRQDPNCPICSSQTNRQ